MQKQSFYSFVFFFPLIAISFFFIGLVDASLLNVYYIVIGVLAVFLYKSSEVLIAYSVTFGALFFAPYVVLVFIDYEENINFFSVPFLVLIFYIADLVLREKINFTPDKYFKLEDYLFFVGSLIIITVYPLIYFIFVGFVGLFFFSAKDKKNEYICVAFFISATLLYLAGWDGFGRTNLVALCLFFALIFCRKREWKLGRSSSILIIILVACLVPIASAFRFGLNHTLTQGVSIIMQDSAFHHLVLTTEILNQGGSFKPIEAFEQILLFFFSWVPREIWYSISGFEKPFGLGFSYVDIALDRSSGENYSVSLGFLGELIYLYGSLLWVLAYFLFLGFLYIFLKFLKSYDRSGISTLYFTAFLITYVWGGGASLGSRVWWFCIPFLIMISISRVRR